MAACLCSGLSVLALAGVALASVGMLKLDPVATQSAAAITIRGTVVCSPGEFAYVYVNVTQGRAHGEGWSKSAWCDGTRRKWTARVWSRTRTFHAGAALLDASVTTFDEQGTVANCCDPDGAFESQDRDGLRALRTTTQSDVWMLHRFRERGQMVF